MMIEPVAYSTASNVKDTETSKIEDFVTPTIYGSSIDSIIPFPLHKEKLSKDARTLAEFC